MGGGNGDRVGRVPGRGGDRAPHGTGHLRTVNCYFSGVNGSWAYTGSELTSLVQHHKPGGRRKPSGYPEHRVRACVLKLRTVPWFGLVTDRRGRRDENGVRSHRTPLTIAKVPNLQTAFGFVTSSNGRTNRSLTITLPEKNLS